VKTRTGHLADKHFPIHPGSDLALALGMMHVIINEGQYDIDYITRYTSGFETLRTKVKQYTPERVEELTGLPRADIVSLAHDYARTRPSVIRLNYGVQRSDRGGAAVQAIAMLPALTGSWREVGGGLQLSTSQAFHLNRTALEMPELQQQSPLGRPARVVNMSSLAHALNQLDSPPVKALVVYNSNPAAIAPNQNQVHKGCAAMTFLP
jgi:Anaerobic dehydrogenases, typically selenocysteine-containing